MHIDLLEQARHLATRDKNKPRQANLRRAVSSAYYALFHLLVGEATEQLLGRDLAVHRAGLARAFTHEGLKSASRAFASGGTLTGLGSVSVPADLKTVGEAVVDLQQARHEADYDAGMKLRRTEVLDLVAQGEEACAAWRRVRKHPAACLYLLALLVYKSLRER